MRFLAASYPRAGFCSARICTALAALVVASAVAPDQVGAAPLARGQGPPSSASPADAARHPLPSHGAAPGDPVTDLAANGRLPRTALRPVAGILLAPAAAASLEKMLDAGSRDGAVLAVTGGYRSLDQQVDLKQRKGWLAARPGTSQHGWGVAVDFDTRVTDFAWLREHAADYGWINPPWAQPGGSKPEPWHWEFVGDAGPRGHGPAHPGGEEGRPPQIGELVASARFEPVYGAVGGWFPIWEGLDGLESGPRRYEGTALPGAPGNFAIAGFQRAYGAPLHGFDRLWTGDVIRVRLPYGDDVLYHVAERAVLSDDEGWAVAPDPTGTGATHVMTITTAGNEDKLEVLWAHLP